MKVNRFDKMDHLSEFFGYENALGEMVRGMSEDEMESSYEHITRNWGLQRLDEVEA
jgi:hypothetical protein